MKSDLIVSIIISIVLIALAILIFYFLLLPQYKDYAGGNSDAFGALFLYCVFSIHMVGGAIALPILSLNNVHLFFKT